MINFQNIQTAHTTQYQKNKQPNQKVGKRPKQPFLHPSPAFIICRLLDRSHSDWCEMVPHSGFDLHFSDNE